MGDVNDMSLADVDARSIEFRLVGLDHVSLTTEPAMMEELKDFYRDVLGMTTGFRPSIGVPGYWMYAEGQPIIHLNLALPGQAVDTSRTTGAINHVSFKGAGLRAMSDRLRSKNIPFEIISPQGAGVAQMFFHDPSGIRVEIIFREPAE